MTRRRALTCAGAAVLFAAVVAWPQIATAACDDLRGQTMSFIVPYSAGGGFDTYARLLEPYLERELGAEIVVHNVTGAGGMTGTKAIRDARPDGRTLGIADGANLVAAAALETLQGQILLDQLTVIGQLAAQGGLWIVGAGSPIASVEELWATTRQRQVVVGAHDLASEEIIKTGVAAELLGIDISYVSGFRGSQDAILALLRGDIDLYSVSLESALHLFDTGEARPILQLAARPLVDHAALAGVPVLAGPDGLAARRGAETGHSLDEARRLADAIVDVTITRRPLIAPAGLAPVLATCLEQAFLRAASDPGFAASAATAGRSLDVRPASETAAALLATATAMRELRPMIRKATEKARP